MKPEQFIREYGVGKAREALTLCCWMDGSFCTRLWHGCVQNSHECCVDVAELKRLVESLDLVVFLGGIDGLNVLLDMANSPFALSGVTRDGVFYSSEKIKEIVAVHESIYGGGDE